jgi:isocitrate dehydrogenase
MGQTSSLPSRNHSRINLPQIAREDVRSNAGAREYVGADVFVETADSPAQLGERMTRIAKGTQFKLKMVSNRGTVVWPATGGSTDCVDHFRCRFMLVPGAVWDGDTLLDLLKAISSSYRWMHVEKLDQVDGEPGFTRAQGENAIDPS